MDVKIEAMKYYLVPEQLMRGLIGPYLGDRPYKEVEKMIALLNQCKLTEFIIEEPKTKETKKQKDPK